MITIHTGNIFYAEVDALVNPINCKGVSGAGLALKMKKKYPENQQSLTRHCDSEGMNFGEIYPVYLFARPTDKPQYIINLPTKYHWRDRSLLEDVAIGVDAMVDWLRYQRRKATDPIETVAVPALGCGLGGLPWVEVLKMMTKRLGGLPEVEFKVFFPYTEPTKNTDTRGLFDDVV